jgi:hypothetical protein
MSDVVQGSGCECCCSFFTFTLTVGPAGLPGAAAA